MRRHLAYLRYVLRHKFFVFLAGIKLGVPLWNLIFHDWTKFTPREWFPYARCFYAPNGESQYQASPEFSAAWNHHQKRNRHHYQYWYILWDRGESEPLPMPDADRREMLADWMGAGRALGKPDTAAWYRKNYDKIKLHPETRRWVDMQLLPPADPLYMKGVVPSDTETLIVDVLGDVSHTIWSDWMRWQMFHVCIPADDGSLSIPVEKVERWRRQLSTPYSALTEREKDSDREQSHKILRALSNARYTIKPL